MSNYDPLHEPDSAEGVEAWFDYREQELRKESPQPLVDRHGVNLMSLKEALGYEKQIAARLKREMSEMFDADTPTPNILRHVNLDAARPDSSAD